jgi:hypothetical protein
MTMGWSKMISSRICTEQRGVGDDVEVFVIGTKDGREEVSVGSINKEPAQTGSRDAGFRIGRWVLGRFVLSQGETLTIVP